MATQQRTEQSRWRDLPRGMDLLNRQGLNKGTAASLLPALVDLRKVAVQIAIAVGLEAQKVGIAPAATAEEVRQQVVSTQWTPAYPSFATTDNK
jgi:malic enzyme